MSHNVLSFLRHPTQTAIEDFAWVAHLDDGAAWPEIGPGGEPRGWASIPAERRVVAIELIAQRSTHHDMRIEIPSDGTAVFFRRRRLNVRGTDGTQYDHQTITVIGWEANDGDRRYWAIDQRGDSIVTNDVAAIG